MKNLRLEIIKTIDEKLFVEWQNLWENSWNAHIFNSPRWFVTVSTALGIKDHLIFVCYKDGKLVALCPFFYSKKFGTRVLTSPGCKYSDKSPFLIYKKDVRLLKFFLSQIFNLGSVYLPEVDEWMVNGVRNAHRDIFVNGPNLSPFIPKEPDLLAFLDKRQKRRIKGEGIKHQENLRFQTFAKEQNLISEIVFAIEHGSARRSAGKGTFTDPNTEKLFNSIMKFWADEVSLDVMYFRDKPISYMFGILDSKTFYALNTAYLEGYQDIIPGKMVVNYLLQRLQALEVELFDFLRGSSRFKQDFTPFFSEQYDIYYSKNFLVKIWWRFVVNFTNFIKESGIFYKIYLAFKRWILELAEPLPKLAHDQNT